MVRFAVNCRFGYSWSTSAEVVRKFFIDLDMHANSIIHEFMNQGMALCRRTSGLVTHWHQWQTWSFKMAVSRSSQVELGSGAEGQEDQGDAGKGERAEHLVPPE